MPAVFAALFIASFILQGYTQIVFTEENDDPLANVFPKKNTVAVVYRNEDEAKIDSVISEHLTHAYALWAANVLLAVFAPAFPLSLGRQEIRPQTAQAHSLGR